MRTSEGIDSRPTLRRLAAAGVAGPLIFWAVVFILGFARPEYSAVRDAISDLGAIGAPFAIVQQVNFVVLGLGILGFAVAVDRRFRTGWRPWVGVVLLGVLGLFGAIGPGVFPITPENTASTSQTLHATLTPLGFLAGLIGIPLTSWRLAQADDWDWYRSRTIVLGITVIVVAAFATFIYVGIIGDYGLSGAAQRLYAGVMSGWVALHAYVLYRDA